MPLVLAVPTAVLAVVAVAAWRLDHLLRAELQELAGGTDRLSTLRVAVTALDDQVALARRRHDTLAAAVPPTASGAGGLT